MKELIAVPGSLIPESGLPVATPTAQTGSDNQDTLKTTVLPKEEPHHPSLAGEPGIVIQRKKTLYQHLKRLRIQMPKL